MCLHRCLLIACVTLSHACDSKEAKKSSQVADPALPRVELAADAPVEQLFAKLSPAMARFILAPDLVLLFAVPAGQTQVVLARDGTLTFGTLRTQLDEPGKNALRAALAEVPARTQLDLVIDRSQTVATLVDLVRTVQPLFPDVRIIAGVPTGPSAVKVTTEHAAVRDNIESVRRCVNRSLASDAPTTGYQLELDFTVDANGAVERGAVRSSAGIAPLLSECLTKAVLTWKVKLPAGTYTTPVEVKVE